MSPDQLTEQEFEDLRGYIHKLCGLYLQPGKKYLILQRLEELVTELGCITFAEFNRLLRTRPTQELHDRIISCMTTNETSFFRDKHPFDAFVRDLLPPLADRARMQRVQKEKVEPVRLWCTAVSTGQEAYSLAIGISEYLAARQGFHVGLRDFRILATDISSQVLKRAASGVYNEVEMQRGLSEERRRTYFTEQDKKWTVAPELREIVEFRRLNLAEPYGVYQDFDVIFCRNVLIYFDDDTKRKIIDLMYRKLRDNGALVLGSAENLYNLTTKFRSEQVGASIIYRKNL